MEANILNNGIEGLKELKDKVIKLDRYQNDNSGIVGDEKRLVRNIKAKEESVEDEINLTIKKRKGEIEATYNQEIAKAEDEIAKVQNKKSKSKSAQVLERIKVETADLLGEYESMKTEIKTKFKDAKVPSFVNTNLFYSLYMPKGTREFAIVLAVLLLVLLIIPCGIYFFLLPIQKVLYLVIIYFFTVVVFGGIYIIIGNKVKDKHLPAIKEVRVIRTSMLMNKIKRDKTRKKILKDKDESVYSLERYNQKIEDIQNEIKAVEGRKKEAIIVFDRDTRPVIIEEIRGLYSEELLNMNTQLTEINEKIKANDESIKYLSRELVQDYEAFLGKEFMSVEKIDRLINLMEENKLENVSQAISHYKKEGL